MYLKDHLEKLPYFYEAAKVGNMKKASVNLNITQPSLSKAISVLEDAVEEKLFIRKPRGIELTKRGKLLFEYCHSLFSGLNNIEKKLATPEDPFSGSLRVGTYDSIGIYFWPKFLKRFLQKYPMLEIEFITGRSSKINQMLEMGEIDFALVIEPKKISSFTIRILKQDSFKFYESTQAKIYGKKPEAPLILMPDALAGDNSLVESINLNETKVYKASTLETVKELTINGLGIGVLPELVARASVSAGQLKQVKYSSLPKTGIGKHDIGYSYPSNMEDSPLINALTEAIEEFDW